MEMEPHSLQPLTDHRKQEGREGVNGGDCCFRLLAGWWRQLSQESVCELNFYLGYKNCTYIPDWYRDKNGGGPAIHIGYKNYGRRMNTI